MWRGDMAGQLNARVGRQRRRQPGNCGKPVARAHATRAHGRSRSLQCASGWGSAAGLSAARPRRTAPARHAAGAKPDQPKAVNALLQTGFIASLFAVWYCSNIYFNIFNKQVLSAFPHPAFCTWVHLLVSAALAAILWLTRIKKAPFISPGVIDIVWPLAIFHLIGFYTTNASIGAVAVSLTHTIKSMEPFFTVVISYLILGFRPAKRILFALVPIVVGVVVASATDLSFNWAGFNAAMLSNVAFQTRNVLSKKAMLRSSYDSLEGGNGALSSLDEVNIFALMSIGALALMTPAVPLVESSLLAAFGPNPMDWMGPDLLLKTVLAGICRFADVLASFLILQRVTPVTHSVGNCVKRVVVIAASIVVFQTVASSANIAGTSLALGGVLLYSLVKRTVKDQPVQDQVLQTTRFEAFLAKFSPGTWISKAIQARKKLEPKKPAPDSDVEYFL